MPHYNGQTQSNGPTVNVTVGPDPAVFPLTPGEGDVHIITDDGTCNGDTVMTYIYDKACGKWFAQAPAETITDIINLNSGHVIGTYNNEAGTPFSIEETITDFGTPTVNATDPQNVIVTLPYNQEDGNIDSVQFTMPIPSPASFVNSIDLKPTGNPNEFTVEITYTDDQGNTVTTTDATPITIPGAPVYTTCSGADLKVTDKILLAPAGTYASGYTINQDTPAGCATLADTYYNRARRSHTFGNASMSNDAQGYGSSITGGLRNTTGTGAAYSGIGSGYDNSITTGTANRVGGGRNNDITAGSYNGIDFGYNNNITAGNYNTIGGGVSNDIKSGSYNTVVGGSAIDFEAGSGSYNVSGGVNHTYNGGSYTTTFGNNHRIDGGVGGFSVGLQNRIRAGNYVSQLGYSHDNVAGSSTTQGGYNHTNTAGSYNSQFGYGHIVDTGQSIFQGGQSNRNRAGNYNSQLGFSHDNRAGSGNHQAGYDHLIMNASYSSQIGSRHRTDAGAYNNLFGSSGRIRGGNYNNTYGHSHDIQAGTGNTLTNYNNTLVSGNYNFMGGVNSILRSGNYNMELGYSSDVTGTGNALLGYNNTTNTNYSVSIGRNLVNTTQDGVMIANNFQKLGFFGTTPVARQTVANTATVATLITALKAYGIIL